MYRAVWPHITPLELDRMEMWQIGVLLGLDERPPHFQLPAVASRPLPPQSEGGEGVDGATRRLRAVL